MLSKAVRLDKQRKEHVVALFCVDEVIGDREFALGSGALSAGSSES